MKNIEFAFSAIMDEIISVSILRPQTSSLAQEGQKKINGGERERVKSGGGKTKYRYVKKVKG